MRDLLADLRAVLQVIDACDFVPDEVCIRALIVAEDRRFYYHFGFDFIAIARATFMTLFLGRLQGASTIEAQLVRTVTGRRDVLLSRKIREIFISTLVSMMRPKRSIASAYLSVAYFGFEEAGILHAAARLGFSMETWTRAQIFFLIALIRRPLSRSLSFNNLQAIERRVAWIEQNF
ncbi:transglycosylase domain-containing protein [Stenotrophomonas geniculata]|nr:biosynthetic peptidoglycan transglycosylase [Stenotrophomonas geniculata]MCR1806312.1 transglycosylase domain-containing protein [Stenotrophomonas geniculata]